MKLSAAGLLLLRVAETVLPEIDALQSEFDRMRDGRCGRLHIAIECHACFECLFPALEKFRKHWPDVNADIRPGLAFDALPALQKEDVDLVIFSDPEHIPEVEFKHLFDYESVFVASKTHPLAQKEYITAADFRDQTLITYPVERSRLDIFSQLLTPNKVEPAFIRPVELTAVILLLVASNRGVSALPYWVIREVKYSSYYVTKSITVEGIHRRLYAAARLSDLIKSFIADLIKWAGREAKLLQNQ